MRQSLANLFLQVGDYVTISLTSKGLEASYALIDMLNDLPEHSSFIGDTLLFDYLSNGLKYKYMLHCELTSTTIVPHHKHHIPLNDAVVHNEYDSGIYGFFLSKKDNTSELGLGSAIACRSRLIDHMSSFNGSRTQQFMHKHVLSNGGLDKLS